MGQSELNQRLAAILAADVVGYSRLMSLDDRATVVALDAARAVFRKHIEANRGRVIDMAGDSVLAVFDTAIGAVGAALATQQELRVETDGASGDRHMRFRMGVHLGDVSRRPTAPSTVTVSTSRPVWRAWRNPAVSPSRTPSTGPFGAS